MQKDKKLLDLVVDKIRVKHYSIKTEQFLTLIIKYLQQLKIKRLMQYCFYIKKY